MLQSANIHHLEMLLIVLLLSVVGFGALAKRLQVAYPIVLVVGGLFLSFIPGLPRVSLEPDLVFLAILPPLLFAAAFTTSWREFRYNLVSIILLAFGLVAFTVIGVALVSRWTLPGFDWKLGLVLGAVVSTTDAIAATSIARRLGLPRRIVDILEGESLVNDASGLLALSFTVALVVDGRTPGFAAGAMTLFYLVGGGIAIGLALGKLVHWMEGYIDDAPIEITISLLTPYVAYLAAEAAHSSGVLATVACGLYLGRQSAKFLSASVRIESDAFWNTLIFALNGIVFLLIGLQLPLILSGIRDVSRVELLTMGVVFSCLVIALRLIWVYPGAFVAYIIRSHVLGQPEGRPAPQAIFVIGWTGMRGVVALAAAISLPQTIADGTPFPERNVILFLTFCVIFVTLVLQGLTLPAVIRGLGVTALTLPDCEEKEARQMMLEAALNQIEESRGQDHPDALPIYEDLAKHYRARLETVTCGPVDEKDRPAHANAETYRNLARQLRLVERMKAIELRDQNRISDEVLRTVQRELDLLETSAA